MDELFFGICEGVALREALILTKSGTILWSLAFHSNKI